MTAHDITRFPCPICKTTTCHHHDATQSILDVLPLAQGFGVSTPEIWLPLLHASACMYVTQHSDDPMLPLVHLLDALESLAIAFHVPPQAIVASLEKLTARLTGELTAEFGNEEATLPGAQLS